MPAYRFPILVWEDYDGGFTAALVDDRAETAAFATSAGDAVGQVGEFLESRYKSDRWRPGPDFFGAELAHVKVEVRPEYQVGADPPQGTPGRVYACNESIALKVPCVRGRDANGLLACALPTLGYRFTYYDPESFKGLVGHYVQLLLKGLTPMQVARHLPPKSVALDEIVIQVRRKESQRQREPALEALGAVAEPLGVRGVRKQLARPWERDELVARLVGVFTREKANVLLLGDSGSGKTAVLAEAVRKVEREKAAEAKQQQRQGAQEARGARGAQGPSGDESTDGGEAGLGPSPVRHRFWMTSAARLIAGMQYLGQWEQRCEQVISELGDIGGVLCVENLLDLVRAGGSGPGASVAAFLVPYLQRGELRLVAEATASELDACRRLLPALADLFQIVEVAKFDRRQAIAALGEVAAAQRRNLRVETEGGVVETAYRLFARFMPYQPFPGRATAFVSELFDRALRRKRGSVSGGVSGGDVIEQFVRQTGLPERFLRDEVPLGRDEVLEELREQVVGQEAACRAAADLVLTFKAGLNDPNRPPGVLLFVGPTGVGKTEMARAISQFFFGHGERQDRLIRLDMSEYAGPGAAERLLGSDCGGASALAGLRGEPSPLIRRVRRQPFSVLLLDEIEKAAPEVFDLLLGVFDEGRLTDPYGRLTTFRSTVIIMTSNLGADRPAGFGLGKPAPPAYDAEAMGFFRPEFFNRIDAVVTFEPLTRQTMLRITEKQLREVAGREGLTRAGLRLRWTGRAAAQLAERGFDRRYGARPLQRALEALVVAPLAKFLIDRPGLRDAEVRLDASGEGGAFSLAAVPGGAGAAGPGDGWWSGRSPSDRWPTLRRTPTVRPFGTAAKRKAVK